MGKMNEYWASHSSFTHSSQPRSLILWGFLHMISIGRLSSTKKKNLQKNNNNRSETHFSGAFSFGVSLTEAAFHAGERMTSLGPSCSLLTQPLSERYSLFTTWHFLRRQPILRIQPNTLNAVKTAAFHKYKFDKKTLMFTGSTEIWIDMKFWRTPGLAAKHPCFITLKEMPAKPTAPPVGQNSRTPKPITLTEACDTISNMSWLCKCVLCLLIMLIRPWPWG